MVLEIENDGFHFDEYFRGVGLGSWTGFDGERWAIGVPRLLRGGLMAVFW